VAGLTDAVEVKAGGYHTCARRMSGQLVCWGYAPAIGDGTEVSKATPQTISLMTNVRSLATGWYHTCVAQGASRNVYCWGWNPTGAVGDGTTNYRVSPRSVGITATQVTAGAGHSCAITGTASWAVKCWGSNGFGQMGTNSVGGQKTPFSVPAPSPTLAVSLIDAGGNFTCATATGSAGNTVCWGANESGQLGNGNTTGTTQRPSYVLGDALKLNGETCSSDGQCQSRNCIDGVCCNSRCGEGVLSDCQACSTAAGAAQNGVCGAELVPPLPLVGRQCGTSPNGLCALYCNGGLTCPPVNNPFLCGG
jgi:alpha-tubulin suppressor-like RCC1 family protein